MRDRQGERVEGGGKKEWGEKLLHLFIFSPGFMLHWSLQSALCFQRLGALEILIIIFIIC